MKKIVLILIVLVLLFGCPIIDPPKKLEKLPDDFKLKYTSGAMHKEWGWYEFEADSTGSAVFTKGMEMALEKKFEFTATKEELLKIYNTAVEKGFFNLNDGYSDDSIQDGGAESIAFTANGNYKRVGMTNYSLEQFDAVESEIVKLIQSRAGENAFDLDFIEECPERELECKGVESEECYSWQSLCGWKDSGNGNGQISAEYCDKLENREECFLYCLENQCTVELCDALMFDAPECFSCETGCCSKCNDLDSCFESGSCSVAWIHPSGESWQFGGCENVNLCLDSAGICDYIFTSYQGFRYTSLIEEDLEQSILYEELADELQALYNKECE